MTDPDSLDFTVPDPWGDLPAYALNALSPEERSRVDALLEISPEARDELRRLLEATENLSHLIPQVEPSGDIRQSLLAQADMDIRLIDVAREDARSVRPPGQVTVFTRALFRPINIAYAGTAAALIAVIGIAVIFGMENSRLESDVNDLQAAIEAEQVQVAELRSLVNDTTARFASQDAEVARLTAVNAGLNEAFKNQQWLTYVTQNSEFRVPNYFVGGPQAPEANGTLAVKNFDDQAVFLVSGLPPAPDDYQYMLSLVHGGVPEAVATFQVNEAGMAKVDFTLSSSIDLYEGAIVSLEPMVNAAGGEVTVISGPEIMTASESR
jgi:hypothetical protein